MHISCYLWDMSWEVKLLDWRAFFMYYYKVKQQKALQEFRCWSAHKFVRKAAQWSLANRQEWKKSVHPEPRQRLHAEPVSQDSSGVTIEAVGSLHWLCRHGWHRARTQDTGHQIPHWHLCPNSSWKLSVAAAARRSSVLTQVLSITSKWHRILGHHIRVPQPRGWGWEYLVFAPFIERWALSATRIYKVSPLTATFMDKNSHLSPTLILFVC